jgi:hypothetical protein
MTNDCNRFLLTVMQKAKLFPKPLIPVQFRAGAPNRLPEMRGLNIYRDKWVKWLLN